MNTKVKMLLTVILAAVLLLPLAACTTATYNGFEKSNTHSDQYSLKVYIGGFAGGETADGKADVEIKKFMTENHYSSYEIINRQHSYVPSYFEYTVRFYRNKK